MPTITLEPLESRRLLSVNLAESEPNNARAKADELPRILEETLEVSGKIATTADHDWFKIKLKVGDVLGVAVTGAVPDTGGLDPYARLVDSAGKLLIENSGPNFFAGSILPAETPLPRADPSRLKVDFYRVIAKAGTYFLDVSSFDGGSSGRYKLEVMVNRPGLESAPRGTKQILFLDFDGATVDWGTYYDEAMQALGVRQLGPWADELPNFGVDPSQERAVVDGILKHVHRKLKLDVARRGLNDDFDIKILNSYDHADPGDHPYVTRVRIGTADDAETLAMTPFGIAQWIDVGNYETDDEAVVFAEGLTIAQEIFPAIDPSATRAQQAMLYFADLITHEAGHLFGNFHSYFPPGEFVGGVPDIMASGADSLGPDLTFGTDDDIYLRFGRYPYAEEYFMGVNDTLNTIAFGLTTGKGGGGDEHCDDDHRKNRGTFPAGNGRSDGVWKRLEC